MFKFGRIRDIADLIESCYRSNPVSTVVVGAFTGACLAAIPLNFVMFWPLVVVFGEIIAAISGAALAVRIGRRSTRWTNKLDREMEHYIATEALDLHQLLRQPWRAPSAIRRALAALWAELGSQGEAVGRMYYDPADQAAQPPPGHQDPDQP